MKPVIGITSGVTITTTNNVTSRRVDISALYGEAVVAAGGSPVILPPLPGTEQDVLAFVDGLIFSGGADINPALFGDETVHPETYGVEASRDTFELALAKLAYAADLPVLGICRGIQSLNVALGGTLIQHVPDVTELPHRQQLTDIPAYEGFHRVTLSPGSHLAGLFQSESVLANSFHHQAIRDVAPVLEIVGQTADGMIEAIEAPDRSCFFALQWHPEMMQAHNQLQLAPFTRLIETARARKLAALPV